LSEKYKEIISVRSARSHYWN